MLIFGKSVADWEAKAIYAQDKGENEFAELREIRCEGAEDPITAFTMMAAFAAHTNCEKFLYHATINLYPGERLTREQWQKAVDKLEKELNLTGHHRVVFEHIKNNRQHYHIVWSRVPPDGDGPTVVMSNNFAVHERVAIELEQEFGLKAAPRRRRDAKPKNRREAETRNGKIREKPETVEAEATKIYHASGTAAEFIKNLSKAGYVLTKGKNGSYVLVDRKGGYHGLLRRLKGVKLDDVRRKFPGLDAMPLPRLNDVLRERWPAPKQGFRRAARMAGSRTRPDKTGKRRQLALRRTQGLLVTRHLAPLIAQINARHPQPERKYYPTATRYKRRRRKDENKPSIRLPSKQEIADAELLQLAWENKWYDILASFGINLMPEGLPQLELIQRGVIPPDMPEP